MKLNSEADKLELRQIKDHRDHYFYELYFCGKYIRLIKLSYGSKEWGNGMLARVASNLGVSISQVKGIESCSFGTADFIEHSKTLTQI